MGRGFDSSHLVAWLVVLFPMGVSAGILLQDGFDYPDGALTSAAGGVWVRHSGTAGDAVVRSGCLVLDQTKTEDVNATLAGQPYRPADAAVLYARFTVNFQELPRAASGGYFAHFKDSSTGFNGRVFVSTNEAAAGCYRLGIANSGSVAAFVAKDLSVATDYLVMVRLKVGEGISTLWVDPTEEGDEGVEAADSPKSIAIAAFAFRQSVGIGVLAVDNLVVGTGFGEVLEASNQRGPPSISQNPVSQSAAVGSQIKFTVSAQGSPPLQYQWLHNDTAIAEATNSVLVLSQVTTNGASRSRVGECGRKM